MKPLAFCLENAIELLSDEERRVIGIKARTDAEKGSFDPPQCKSFESIFDATYMMQKHRQIFYQDAFDKRAARLERLRND